MSDLVCNHEMKSKAFQMAWLFMLLLSLSACSLALDPSICERDSDCGGGVCQLGICVGPRDEINAGVVSAGVDGGMNAGAGMDAGMDAGQMGGEGGMSGMEGGMAGQAGAGVMAGIEGGEGGVLTPDSFTCRFRLEDSLGASQASYQERLYTSEAELNLVMELYAPESWTEQMHLLLGSTEHPLMAEGEGRYTAQVTLATEGEYRLRLLIGSEGDVRCAEALDVIFDQTPPILEITRPLTGEEWLQAQEGVPSAQVEMSLRDLSPVSILQDTQVIVSDLVSVNYTQSVSLAEGENRFSFVARDLVGNESNPIEVVFHYDPEPPFLVISTPAQPTFTTDQAQLTIEGVVYAQEVSGEGVGIERQAQLELSHTYNLLAGGMRTDRSLASADERGIFGLLVNLREGLNQIQVCAYDLANNQHCASRSIDYVVAQPCLNVSSAHYSSEAEYTLTANLCSSVSRVTLSVNGDSSISIPINQNVQGSNISYSVLLGAQGSTTTLSLVASSDDGQQVTLEHEVTLDQTPPTITLISPSDESCTHEPYVELCARIIDQESPIATVRLNQSILTAEDVESPVEAWWTQFCVTRPVGGAPFTLSAENEAGLSSSQTRIVYYDIAAPVVTFSTAEEGWYGADERGVTVIEGSFERDVCGLATNGVKIYRLALNNEEEIRINPPFTPNLVDEDGVLRFSYPNTYAEGSHAIEVELQDRAGNISVSRHHFQVDLTPPELFLNQPLTEEVVGRDATLQIELLVIDEGSGLSLTGAQANEVSLTVSPIAGTDSQWMVSGAVSFDEGTHAIIVRILDAVGNSSELPLLYIRDLTPPVATLASPAPGEGVHRSVVSLVSASDDASGVSTVTVNGVNAAFNGTYWIATSEVDPLNPSITVDVHDRAGNLNRLDPITVTLPTYALRPSERSALPGVDEGMTGDARLWWGEWGEGYSLLIMSELQEQFQTGGEWAFIREQAGISDQGATRAIPIQAPNPQEGRFILKPQASLPSMTQLRGEALAYFGPTGILSLFTLVDQDAGESAPVLSTWQLGSHVGGDLTASELESLIPVPFVEQELYADVIHLMDLTADGRMDLVMLKIGENSSGEKQFFEQTDEGTLSLGVNVLNDKGLGALSTPTRQVGEAARGRLWSLDVNRDDRVDLIQEATSTEGAKLWFAQPSSSPISYLQSDHFPTTSVSGYLLIDWDDADETGGEANLDLLAWTENNLYKYTLNVTGEWDVETLVSFPSPVRGVEVLDVDMDGQQEVLTFGVGGIQAWNASGGSNPVYADLLPSINPVEQILVTDLDQDGDEDLLIRQQGALWAALANGITARPEGYYGVRLEFVNDTIPQNSSNVRILIDEDRDFTFERVLLSRTRGETVLPFAGAGQVNIQLIFPDRGEPGGNQVALTGVVKGSLQSAVDPQ